MISFNRRLQVWIYEPEQLVRVILSRPPSEVQSERDEILIELTNVTKKLIIIDDIRYHVDGVGRIRMDWSDLFFHAVDPTTKNIVPVFDILNEIDSKYDFLKDYYSVSRARACTTNVCPTFNLNSYKFIRPGLRHRERHSGLHRQPSRGVRYRTGCHHCAAHCALCRCDKLHRAVLLPEELGDFDSDRDETERRADKEANN